jgi:hypothetical protein
VEHKQHQEMNGIYNRGSNNTNTNIQVRQIGTPSCRTLFLMVLSLPKQSATSQCLSLDCITCWSVQNLAERTPSTNGSKSWHQQMLQACCTWHGQMHTNCYCMLFEGHKAAI